MTVTIPVPSRGMTVTSIDPDWANHTSDPKIKLTYGRSQRGHLFQMLSGNTTTFRRAGYVCYGVATISRLLKIIGLFCKRALYKRRYSAKETYDFKEPTNRSQPICKKSSKPLLPQMCHQPGSAVSSAMRLRKFSIGFALSRWVTRYTPVAIADLLNCFLCLDLSHGLLLRFEFPFLIIVFFTFVFGSNML